ncbi:hypothetical protein ACW0Z6_004459 [Vibrio alginolyticus]
MVQWFRLGGSVAHTLMRRYGLEGNMKKSIVPDEFRHYFDDWHFSPVIEADGTVYLSGVTAARKGKQISTNPEE